MPYELLVSEDMQEHMQNNDRKTIYINKDGVLALISKSNLPNSVAIAERINVKCKTKYLRKETEIIASIQQFLTTLNISFEFQKSVDSYRVDLYINEYKIAVEIDEYGHSDRCPRYEQVRERYRKDA